MPRPISADHRADLDRLVLGQVAQMLHLDLSVRVLVNRERVDHADGLLVMQPLELGDDLAVKLGVAKAYDDQLNWSNCHRSRLSNRRICGLRRRRFSNPSDTSPKYSQCRASGPAHKRAHTTLACV
jgi:hypothetical protein